MIKTGAPETTRGRGGQAGNRGPGLPHGIFHPLSPLLGYTLQALSTYLTVRKYGGQ